MMRGVPPLFDRRLVDEVLERAKGLLHAAEAQHGLSEAQLQTGFATGLDRFGLIRKRSQWPYIEYTCKFSVTGALVPASFKLINRPGPPDAAAAAAAAANLAGDATADAGHSYESRRAFREQGWLARDRFIHIPSLPFDYRGYMAATWLEQHPQLCGRAYHYLFDKGTGKPDLWLFSPLRRAEAGQMGPVASVSAFLASLGCFKDVVKSKIGDRISLAFTCTAPCASLRLDQIVPIYEVVGNGFPFSDGCGIMGIDIAMVSAKWP